MAKIALLVAATAVALAAASSAVDRKEVSKKEGRTDKVGGATDIRDKKVGRQSVHKYRTCRKLKLKQLNHLFQGEERSE